MKLRALILWGFAFLASVPFVRSEDALEEMVETRVGYHVRFTDDIGKGAHAIKYIQAYNVADIADRCHRAFLGHPFQPPDFGQGQDIRIQNDYGTVGMGKLVGETELFVFLSPLDPGFLIDGGLRRLLVRGLFTRILYLYWTEEERQGFKLGFFGACRAGMGCLMEDKTFPDLDNLPPSHYREQIDYVFSRMNNSDWPALAIYPGNRETWAVFWTYFAERLGRAHWFANGNDFDVGVDDLPFALYHIQQTKDLIKGLDTILGAYSEEPHGSFKTYWRDFVAALYAKDFTLDSQEDQRKYGFIDEDVLQAKLLPTSYNLSTVPSDSCSLNPWGGRVYNFVVDTPDDPVCGISVHSTKPLAVSLMTVGPGNFTSPGHIREVIHRYGTEAKIAFHNNPADPITHFGVAFATFENAATPSFTAVSGKATLDLVDPTDGYPAFVGNLGQRKILARVRVGGPSELGVPTVLGLTQKNFSVTVGGEPGIVESCAIVGGEYWLKIRPPGVKPGPGDKFILQISCLGASDAKEDVVIYNDLYQPQVLAIDLSGDMSVDGRCAAANAATKFLIDSTPDSDKIGLSGFFGEIPVLEDPWDPTYDDAMLLAPVTSLVDPLNRANLLTIIDLYLQQFLMGGSTAIGDGLGKALEALNVNAASEQKKLPKVIILLSAGVEECPALWEDVKDIFINQGVVIHTIALGDEGNAKMQTIATQTKGKYSYVPMEPGWTTRKAGSRSTGYLPQSLAVRLADTYLQIEDRIQDRVRLWSAASQVAPGGTAEYPVRLQEGAITQAVLSAVWANAETSFTMRVYDPDGTLVTNGTPDVDIFHDATHEVYQFGTMSTGSWTVLVDSLGTATSEFQAALSGQGNLVRMQTWLDGSSNLSRRLAGEPIGMRALLSDATSPIVDAQIAVTVRHPDGTTNRFRLRDDGLHGDEGEADGIYDFSYTRTTQPGSYLFLFQARGNTSSGATFTREESLSAYVTCNPENGGDADSDGMADPWELLHDLDTDSDDGAYDFDGDGLSNLLEYMAGCDPRDPDTDDGGITDGSEVALGRNPLEELDDDMEGPGWGMVVLPRGDTAWIYTNLVQTNALLIEFPVDPTYRFVHLYRSTMEWPLESYVRVKKMDVHTYPGRYLDSGLENDQPYYYYLVAEGTNEQISVPSPVFSGIPKADPIPATGWVRINEGARRTISLDATLTFDPSSDATEMMVSEDASFATNTWIPKANSMPWTLTPSDSDPPIATVYAKFRRGPSNNESDVSIASIAYDPDGDADNDGLSDDLDLDDDNDGIPDDVESASYLDSNRPDSDGDGIPDADEDTDYDGQTTRDELSGGSNPGDPNSRFEVLRIGLTDGICRVAAPYASGRNIHLQLHGPGLGGGSWSNAPLAGSVVGPEMQWDAPPSSSTLYYRVAANSYIPADFAAIDKDDIAQASVSGDLISGNDEDNQLTPGSILLCHTSSGRFTKFLIESWGYDLSLRWVTYDADGSPYSSGTGLLIRGTWACDLDEGLETESNRDFRWDQLTGSTRRLTPQNGALFFKAH